MARRAVSFQRQTGAYYTCPEAALAMAEWVLGNGARTALEPSFGDGAFVHALRAAAEKRAGGEVEVFGAELVAETYDKALSTCILDPSHAHLGDFLAWDVPTVDAVIGNPPYVRLRNAAKDQCSRALAVSARELGAPMETGGSVWMPFVLHAARALASGGRMALVLPFDLTYVRYARPLWRWLGAAFGGLRLARVHQRIFPEILQDVVVLYADRRGGQTDHVRFDAFASVDDFLHGSPLHRSDVSIAAVGGGERALMRALLPCELLADLDGPLARASVPVRSRCAFNIGYV
ncbi:MAG: N-6 DNA methylase [Deltaproteobacteria bacterium]|nr:N-6 DNA methylase [Deltaproteobacteria bacterium]